jgi:hypothetical protein
MAIFFIIIITIGSTALCGPWPSSEAPAGHRPAVASSVFVTFSFRMGFHPHAQPLAILEDQYFLSGLSLLAGWSQFESVRNSVFARA